MWFVRNDTELRLYRADEIDALAMRVADVFASAIGTSAKEVASNETFLDDLGADSLDMAELQMELEEEFGITITEDDAQRVTTVADAIAYLRSRLGKR